MDRTSLQPCGALPARRTGRLCRTLLLAAVLLCLSFFPVPVSAAEGPELGTLSCGMYLDMWHYSGGYWKVGNAGADKIVVSDMEMNTRGLSAILAEERALFRLALPSEAAAAVKGGREVCVEASGVYESLDRLFEASSISCYIDENYLYFSAKPRFNIIPESVLSFADYGLPAASKVPLVDRSYGCNIYAIYGNGVQGAQANGWVDASAPFDTAAMPAGRLHPGWIAGAGGALKPGFTILTQGRLRETGGLSVGKGTFSAAGAVGLSFQYNVRFRFWEYQEEPGPALPGAPDPEPLPEPTPEIEEIAEQIEIAERRTYPDCHAYLTGRTIQNRRMTVHAEIEQDPDAPLAGVEITITAADGGEPQTLRMREPQREEESLYGVHWTLDFLDKSFGETYCYTVTAVDVLGRSSTSSGTFTVSPDLPPEAAIALEPFYLREEGSNFAEIAARSASVSPDGDPLRCEWLFKGEDNRVLPLAGTFGYHELGGGAEIVFPKEGVGPFSVILRVTESWDDTLPEFVGEGDRLGAECFAGSVVDNVAPHVGVELAARTPAEILLVSQSEEAALHARELVPSLQQDLLSGNVRADIALARVSDAAEAQDPLPAGSVRTAFGHQGAWAGFWENGAQTADESRLYTAEATWTMITEPYVDCLSHPYYLRAWSLDGLEPLWTSVITPEICPGDLKQARFGHDDSGRYLCIEAPDLTLVFSKESGAFLASVPRQLSELVSVRGDLLYSYDADGIRRVSLADGSSQLVCDIGICGPGRPAVCGGRVHFAGRIGARSFRAAFDPATEDLRLFPLEGVAEDAGLALSLLDFDADGGMLAEAAGSRREAFLFDPEGRCLARCALQPNGTSFAVRDANGGISYVCQIYPRDYISGFVYLTSLADGAMRTASVFDLSGPQTVMEKFLFAKEDTDGSVTVATGAELRFINHSFDQETPRAYAFRFEKNADYGLGRKLNEFCPDLANDFEYGQRCGNRILLVKANNVPTSAFREIAVLKAEPLREASQRSAENRALGYEADHSLVREVTAQTDPAALAQSLRQEMAEGVTRLEITEAEEGGELLRGVPLTPGKTYYYEYDTDAEEDILEVRIAREDAALAQNGGWRVAARYEEPFNGPGLQPFFETEAARFTGGAYELARVVPYDPAAYPDAHYYKEQSSQIHFAVPEGCRASLGFSYRFAGSGANSVSLMLGRAGEAARNVAVDLTRQSGAGTYLHKTLLEPGTYTLSGTVRSYEFPSSQAVYFLQIDDLEVLLLEEAAPGAGGPEADGGACEVLPARVRTAPRGGLNHVYGSFTAPEACPGFARVPEVSVLQGTDHACGRLVSNNSFYQTLQYTVQIPAGQTAVYAQIGAHSDPGIDVSSVQAQLVTWTWENMRYQAGPVASDLERLMRIPNDWLFFASGLTGTHRLTEQASRQARASGAIRDALLAVAPTDWLQTAPAAIAEGQYFLDGEGLCRRSGLWDGNALLALRAPQGTAVSDLKLYTVEDGRRVYVTAESFRDPDALARWQEAGLHAQLRPAEAPEEDPPLVYAIGEYVDYRFFYSDYEDDPSRESVYCYEFEPADEGGPRFTLEGQELSEPVHRFYVPGRYTLKHWQFDDASRRGASAYDKQSNVCSVVFFVQGEAPLPWEEEIEELLQPPAPEDPEILQAVAGVVLHTPKWEENRQRYNERRPDRARAEEVFWPQEELVLQALVCGEADRVSAGLPDYPQWSAELARQEKNDAGERLLAVSPAEDASFYCASLWDERMASVFGSGPVCVTVRFTARFGEEEKTYDVSVTFLDDPAGLWQIHRQY